MAHIEHNPQQSTPCRVLFYEPLAGGHRAEFVEHLLRAIAKRTGDPVRCHFLLAPETAAQSRHVAVPATCTIEAIPEREARQLEGSGPFGFWSALARHVGRLKPDHLFLLELTRFELPLCLFRLPCPLSAILFVQYPYLRLNQPRFEPCRAAKYRLKDWKTAALLRRQRIQRLFLLNGDEAAAFLNARFGTSFFAPLADPCGEVESDPSFSVRSAYGIPDEHRIMLFFGSFSARKGTLVLLDALKRLAPDAARSCVFLFCGHPEPRFAAVFEAAVAGLRRVRSDIQIAADLRRFPETHMAALFQQADWLLIPYTRPEYSSGILARAAAAATPVIGPDRGLLGRLIDRYQLGMQTEVRAAPLAEAIVAAANERYAFDETKRMEFVRKSDPSLFANAILDAVSGAGGAV